LFVLQTPSQRAGRESIFVIPSEAEKSLTCLLNI
jgi:hypothetical protein